MKCINKYIKLFCILVACLFLSGCKEENILTEYEKQNYNINLYTSELYTKDLCVSSENVAIEGFDSDSSLYASALFDLTNKKVAFAENIHNKVYPASTTKILTSLVAMENCDMNEIVTVSNSAAASSFAYDEQVCGLIEGDQITMLDLLGGLLVWSGNDSAVAIAEHVAGSVEAFATLMNKKALELHAANTNFVTPNGLHNDNHYTTAYDMYLIFNECIKHEEFINIISSTAYTANITGVDGIVRQKIWESTSFYARDIVLDPEGAVVIGGKTGYTGEAGNCLILLDEDSEGNQYISIVMGASDKNLLYEDMTSIINQIPNI